MILVTTAGKVGARTARTLARGGEPVRVLMRDAERHRDLAEAGVQLLAGDLDDQDALRRALDGVTAVVLVSPAVPAQEKAVIAAAAAAAVSFIVKVTSKASSDSPIERRRGQTEIEEALQASGIPHTLLRSNAYMQNFLVLAPVIAATGAFASSAADGRVGLIDADDVGDVAAAIVRSPEAHTGKTYWLTGPSLLSYSDVADDLTAVLERTITFSARTRDEDEAAQIDAGVPASIAAQNAKAFSLIADGDAEWLSEDVSTVLGRKARSFREFVDTHAEAFAAPVAPRP